MRFRFLSVCLAALAAADRRVVTVPEWSASPLFSHAMSAAASLAPSRRGVSHGVVYVSGNIGVDMAALQLCPGGIRNETVCAFANIERVLEVAGAKLGDVVECTVFLASMEADYQGMNEAYTAIFPVDPPARAAFGVGVNGIALNAAAEFKCTAALA